MKPRSLPFFLLSLALGTTHALAQARPGGSTGGIQREVLDGSDAVLPGVGLALLGTADGHDQVPGRVPFPGAADGHF